MSLLGGWLLVPLVFALLCVGIGLLAERVARTRVPCALVPGVGLAGLIVVAGLLTLDDRTAELAAPVCGALAVAGLGLGRVWRDPRVRSAFPWAAGVAGVAFLGAASPSLLSGQGSVLGYIKLDDSAIWLGLIEHVMQHGRDLGFDRAAPRSTFDRDLVEWLDNGYPIGSFLPVGVVARLAGQEYVTAYQPVITGFVAVLALGLFAVARTVVRAPGWAALVALLGVNASLFAGYVAWGSIKEVCFAALLPVLLALPSLPLAALVAGGMLVAFGIGGAVYVGPAALLLLVAQFRRGDSHSAGFATFATGLLTFCVASVPTLTILGRNTEVTLNGAPSAQEDFGKLSEALELLQGAGLWLAGDFRERAEPYGLSVFLAVLGLLLAAAACVVAVRRRAWVLPGLVAVTVVSGAVALARGGPWIDAKVLAMAAPVLLAAAAIALLAQPRTRPFVLVLMVGASWSSFLVFRDVYVAPRASLAEQRDMAEALAGRGPTLVLNYEGYLTRYLLADAEAEGATDLRVSLIPDREGNPFPDYTTVEIDDVDPNAVYPFRALLRRVTPTGSRPPSPYVPLRSGDYFEAWTKDPARPDPVARLPRSDGILPAAQVTCRELRDLARTPGARTLLAQPRENPVIGDLNAGAVPAAWRREANVQPVTDGRASLRVTVPAAGRHRLWVGGAALGRVEAAVDGRAVGAYRHQLDATVGYLRFGVVDLAAGEHTITVAYERGPFWRAGRGTAADQLTLGPVALEPLAQPRPVTVPVADVDRLCDGRTYDWIEALP